MILETYRLNAPKNKRCFFIQPISVPWYPINNSQNWTARKVPFHIVPLGLWQVKLNVQTSCRPTSDATYAVVRPALLRSCCGQYLSFHNHCLINGANRLPASLPTVLSINAFWASENFDAFTDYFQIRFLGGKPREKFS